MPKKKEEPEFDVERLRQIEAGREMVASEFQAQEDTHREVKKNLYATSRKATEALEKAMAGGGKESVIAALGVLDRTGHPPVRKIQTEEAKGSQDQSLLVGQVIESFRSLGGDILGQILEGLVSANPALLVRLQARQPLAIAEESGNIIDVKAEESDGEEEVVEAGNADPGPQTQLERMRSTIRAESIAERSGDGANDPED